MKKLLVLLTLLGCLSSLMSQETTVEWGEEVKVSKKNYLKDIIGDDKTGFYALKVERKGKNRLVLEHYNQKMNRTKLKELELKQQKKKLDFEFTLQLKDKIYIFSSFRNQKLKKKFLFVQSINKKTLSLNRDLKKIAEINYAKNRRRNSGDFGIEVSGDESKVLIYYNLPYDKGSNEKFGFHVLNNEMEELWERKVTLPYKEELFWLDDYEVTSSGDMYIIGRKYKDKAVAKRKGKPNYQYHILGYSFQSEDYKEYPISVAGHFLTDMQISINEEENILCGGFYSEVGQFGVKGSYFLSIDGKTKEILTKSFNEFGIDFITQNMTARQEKKAKKKKAKGKDVELYNYDLRGMITREDDGVILIGEQFYVRVYTTTTTNSQGVTMTTTHYQYTYNDIIVISISPEGEIEWTEKIPKNQFSTDDMGKYLSFALSVVKDQMYFIYNDNIENLSLVPKKQGKIKGFRPGMKKSSVVTVASMDSEGRFTRKALFKMDKNEVITQPKLCKQISENEMIIFSSKKKTQRFAKVTFNN